MKGSSPALALPRPEPRVAPRPRLRGVDAPGTVGVAPVPAAPWSQPEMVDSIVGAAFDLTFLETAVEMASFGLVTALGTVPALAGVALLRDTRRGGYVVVYAQGPKAFSVVRARVDEDDALLALAATRGAPTSIEYATGQAPPERHSVFGDPWSVVVVPLLRAGRCIGAFELVDPLDGRPLGSSARDALATLAHHVADVVASLGPDIDVDGAFAPWQVGLED